MERVSDEELAEYAPSGDDAGLMAREIRAYRESGALEALKAADRLVKDQYRSWAESGGGDECPHGVNRAIACFRCDRETLRAAIAKLEAIDSGAVDESKALNSIKF